MYFFSVTLLLFVLPLISIAIEAALGGGGLMSLAGKWFTFWGCGARLFSAGVMQTIRPQFTAGILGLKDDSAYVAIREVGFGNLAMGTVALASLALPGWTVPAAVAGALFYGLAGFGHAFRKERNAKEQFALVTDLLISAILAVFVIWALVRAG